MTIQEQRRLLSSLHFELRPFQNIVPWKIYSDIVVTSLSLWIALLVLSLSSNIFLQLFLGLVIYTAMFRGVALIHEVVHFKNKVPGLETLFNVMIGFPLRVPAYTHIPHQFHHNPTTFATDNDPEYLYLKGKGPLYFYLPILQGLVAPLMLALRFGIYPTIAMIMPKKIRKFIYQKASTIVVNPFYERPIKNDADLKTAFMQDLGCSLVFKFMLLLFAVGLLNAKFFIVGYLFSSLTAMVNIYRARVAHLYDNESNEALDPLTSLRDSVNVTGGLFTFLWAPTGLRYHALHHLSPQIPYYNLGKAHKHLLTKLEANHPYQQTIVENFATGIKNYKNLLQA